MNKILFLFVLFFCVTIHVNGQRTQKEKLNILIIGNSFSRDAFSYVPAIMKDVYPSIQVEMEILYKGGKALDAHWNSINNSLNDYILDSWDREKEKWIIRENVLADSVISSGIWDLLILQEGSSKAHSYQATQPYISQIVSHVKDILPNIKVAYMINPAWAEGYEKLYEYSSIDVWSMFVSVAQQLIDKDDVQYVIPCGTGIQNARLTYFDAMGDFGHLSYDGRHLQEGLPCFIDACTATESLFKIFGIEASIENSTQRITQQWVKEKNVLGRHGKVVEGRDSDYRLAEICAMKAIESPYTLGQTTVAEVFSEIFIPGHFNLEAHRGLSSEYPENTSLAFEQAGIMESYDAIETDVRQTCDGILVCMHDSTIDRTTDGSGKVNSMTYSQLQQYYIDGGIGWNNRYKEQLKVPTFADFLEVCRLYDKIPYVELSSLSNDGVAAVISTLHDYGFEDGSYVLTSFSLKSLKYASTICDAPLEYMKATFSDSSISSYSNIRNIVLRPSAKNITPTFIEECLEIGLITECYSIGVGNDSQLQNLISLGVWGGTCNSYKFSSTSLQSIRTDSFNALIYDLRGNRVNHLQKGMNLIRLSDGKNKKVVWK